MKHNKLETARNNDQSCKVNWWQQGRARNSNTEGKTGMKATEGKRYGQPTRQPAHTNKAQHRLFSSSKHMTFRGKKSFRKVLSTPPHQKEAKFNRKLKSVMMAN